MKRSLTEELERIHTITYGKKVIEEQGFLDKLLKGVGLKKDDKKIDDPKKADLLSDDVSVFFDTLESAADGGGISQQEKGSMSFQKEVESMQIGLVLLGYELPVHGIDGLFGPETAAAVSKFTREKVSGDTKTSVNEAFVRLGDTSYSNVKFDKDGTQYDQVNQALLDDLQTAASKAGVTITITTAKSGHSNLTINGRASRHATNTAVDIAILDGVNAGGATNKTNGNSRFRELGDKLKNELVSLGYSLNAEGGNQKAVLWQTNTGGNHFNHLHVSNNEGVSGSSPSETMVKATPEMLKKLIELLKEKGVTSEDLKKHIDAINLEDLADQNFYAKLLENLGAPVSEENLKFLYAWRQAEGKAGKFNPFNTTHKMPNATDFNSVGVKNYQTLQDGMVATIKTLKNGRYNCIVDGLKNDIGASNIAKCESLKTWGTGDLVAKVVSSYNAGSNPKVSSLA